MYEHRIIDHKTSERAPSINHPEDPTKEPSTSRGTRQSARNIKKDDYNAMDSGSNQLTTENT